jgi:hypothetical protein
LPAGFAKCPTPACQFDTLDVTTSALLLTRFPSVISITKRLKIGVIVGATVFKRDDVIDVGSLAINDLPALPASERITYQDPLTSRFPIARPIVRRLFCFFGSWPLWPPSWYLSRHDLSVNQTASVGAGVLLQSAV